jgi:hypothetical protein
MNFQGKRELMQIIINMHVRKWHLPFGSTIINMNVHKCHLPFGAIGRGWQEDERGMKGAEAPCTDGISLIRASPMAPAKSSLYFLI